MNRRTLLGRLATVGAALAGADMVAPSVVGASEAPDTSEADAAMARMQAGMRTWSDVVGPSTGNTISVGHNTTLGGTGRVINLGPGTYDGPGNLRGASNVTIRGAGPDQTTIVQPPTFEAMAQDCEARGCRFGMRYVARSDEFRIEHQSDPSGSGSIVLYVDEAPGWLARADAWRRSLHEAEASEGTYLPSGDVHLASYWRGWDEGAESITHMQPTWEQIGYVKGLNDSGVLMHQTDQDAVADAYERGRAVEAARAESRQALGLPLERDADA